MEKFLLGLHLAGDELDVVHQQQVRPAVFLPEFAVAPGLDGADQLVGEIVPFYVDYAAFRTVMPDGVGDGIEEVGLPQAGIPVDQQGVVFVRQVLRDGLGRGEGHLVGVAHDEFLKGEFLAAEGVGSGAAVLFQILLHLLRGEDADLEIRGENLLQHFLEQVGIAGEDDLPAVFAGAVEQQQIVLHLQNPAVAEPGGNGGVGQVPGQQLQYLIPEVRIGIHGWHPLS